jgi:hypothetical protein
MIEALTSWLDFLGWGKPHLMAILYAIGVSTAIAQFIKYPVRLLTDARRWSYKTFAYMVRTLAGLGALIAAAVTWPEDGRFAFLGGVLAFVIVHYAYELTSPIVAKFFPWISAEYVAKVQPLPPEDDGKDSGV